MTINIPISCHHLSCEFCSENVVMQFDLVKSRGQLVAEKRRKSERAKLRRKKDDKKKKKGRQLVDADSLLEGKRTGRSRGSNITLVFTCVQRARLLCRA